MSSDFKLRRNSAIILVCILIGGGILLFSVIGPALAEQKESDCTSSQKYDAQTKHCKEKTKEEKEADQKAKAETDRKAKLENEAKAGKSNGTVCLTTTEARSHINENACVVYYPTLLSRSGEGYLFLDENENYKTGFVAFFAHRNMLSWDDFRARYGNRQVVVSGVITMYEGHPQIKVTSLDQVTEPKLLNCETSYGCIYTKGAPL